MIKRFYATKDNTISNAFEENLVTRATGSNMGASDILEVFSIYNQVSNSSGISSELARTLIEFNITEISSSRGSGAIPVSGSVSFYLKMYNAPHSQTVPSEFTLSVQGVSGSWQEGYGIDMDFYEDLTKNGIGSNWINAQQRTAATATITAASPGSLLGGATFTLTNAAGITTTYRINGGGTYSNQTGGTAGNTIDLFIGGASSVAHIAEAVTKVINETTSADMTATNDGTNVTVTQTTKGTAGNKTNTDNSSGLASVGNFEGALGQWTSEGGDFYTDSSSSFTQSFPTGLEDLCIDVTTLVEQWINTQGNTLGSKDNNGFVVKFTNALETTSRSFFTKKFFGRDSEFHYQKPVLEARWDSARRDDRGSFYASSSLVSANDNLNTLYLYNRVRGRLRDYPVAPTSASIRLSANTPIANASASVGRVSAGIYSASIAFETTSSSAFDVWYSGSTAYHTGTISIKSFASYGYNPEDTYVLSMPSLRKEYRKNQTHRLNLYVREKNWSPNIHTQAVRASIPSLIIPSASYQLRRCIDDYIVVPYGTGSSNHTGLSYDVSGNYFDLDTTYLESGYLYDVQYSFYDEENSWEEQPFRFKFRVVD